MERISRRTLFKAGVIVVALPALVVAQRVCEIGGLPTAKDSKIQELENTLGFIQRNTPECVVDDIDDELFLLRKGLSTFSQRPISPQTGNAEMLAILSTRTTTERELQGEAARIIEVTPDKDQRHRSLLLSKVYASLAEREMADIKALSGNEEMKRELTYLIACHLAKSITLEFPYQIADLRQEKVKTVLD